MAMDALHSGNTRTVSPPRKLRSKNPKVAPNLWQKLHKKLGKVACNFAQFLDVKILLWSFGTLAILATNNKTTSFNII